MGSQENIKETEAEERGIGFWTSWICLGSAFVLPAIFWILVSLRVWQGSEQGRDSLGGIFLQIQIFAVFTGVFSFGFIKRSGLGDFSSFFSRYLDSAT